MAENSAAKSGIEITPPQKRGATTRATGSTAIISIAESCSVAFIRPISAVIAEPTRLAKPSRHTWEVTPAPRRSSRWRRAATICMSGGGRLEIGAVVGRGVVERHRALGFAVDELVDEGLGARADLGGRALGDDAARRHEVDVVDHAERILHVVRDDDRGGAERIVQLADQAR